MLAAGIALAIAAASFAAAGGLRLERTTNVLIAAMLAGAALVATAIIQRPWTRDAPLYGGGALLAVAVLAAGTALSVIWSLAPSDSWIEAARTFAYLALFAAGMALVRLEPRGLVGGARGRRRWLPDRLRLGAADQGLPRLARLGGDLRPAARAVRVLELGRADGRARRAAAAVARRAALRPRGRQRAGVARYRPAAGVPDAGLLAGSAGRAADRPRAVVRGRAAAAARDRRAGGRRARAPARWSRGRSRRTASPPIVRRSPPAWTPATSSARCSC